MPGAEVSKILTDMDDNADTRADAVSLPSFMS